MFIQLIQTNPQLYLMIVLAIIISVVLHELAHGWAAIWQGDDTPIHTGHMTGNPIVHMGVFSLAAVFIIGMGWGQMPVDPSRFRSRRGDVWVSLAGPAMNVLLAIVALSLQAALIHFGPPAAPSPLLANAHDFLWVFGFYNIGLAIFNLAPVPPLDGSRLAAGLSPGIRQWFDRTQGHHQIMFMGYFVLIMSLEETRWGLWNVARDLGERYLSLLLGV